MRAAIAPGKVILTGEHAVVHGGAALAMAIDRHIHALYIEDDSNRLRWKDPVSGKPQSVNQDELKRCVDRLEERYESWLKGHLSIQQVVQHHSELFIYTLAQAIKYTGFPSGDVKWRSKLPIGAGMGSSAAFIALILKLFASKSLDSAELLHKVHFCERLQHGKGSLIDASSVTLGGTVRVKQGHVESVEVNDDFSNCYWIFTGTPDSSTGECVEKVRKQFTGSPIWDAFAEIEAQWLSASVNQRGQLIQQNHRLLCEIGVVPKKVQQLITQIESFGGAAKISGAGSIRGDAGGLIIAWLPANTPEQLNLPKDANWGVLRKELKGAQAFSI
ncbi:MAG: mevalonate kinase [Oceanospirillales bacterium]|nr:MAG: mevalonate kinase [Oceanospirillales bacterium]